MVIFFNLQIYSESACAFAGFLSLVMNSIKSSIPISLLCEIKPPHVIEKEERNFYFCDAVRMLAAAETSTK